MVCVLELSQAQWSVRLCVSRFRGASGSRSGSASSSEGDALSLPSKKRRYDGQCHPDKRSQFGYDGAKPVMCYRFEGNLVTKWNVSSFFSFKFSSLDALQSPYSDVV